LLHTPRGRRALAHRSAFSLVEGSAIAQSLNNEGTSMQLDFWIAAVAMALASAGVTWWAVRHSMLDDLAQRREQLTATVAEQNAATHEKLRVAHMRAQVELEQLRASVRAQIAVAVSAEKAARARLESQLTLAYSELDRMRQQASPNPQAKRDLAHAFAETEAMESR
jgi:hypothetical protein